MSEFGFYTKAGDGLSALVALQNHRNGVRKLAQAATIRQLNYVND